MGGNVALNILWQFAEIFRKGENVTLKKVLEGSALEDMRGGHFTRKG